MSLDQLLMLPPGYGFDNAAPRITVPGAQSATSNVALAITGTSIADADNNNQTVSISVSHGTFSLASTTGLSFSVGDGTDDASMTFSGTLANINTAIATLTYTSTSNYEGSDTLTIDSTDSAGGAAIQKTVAITVTWNPFSLGSALKQWNDPYSNVYSDAGSTAAVIDTDSIQQWNDQSGNGNHLSQAGSTLRPLYKTVSGKKLMLFDGSNDSMANTVTAYQTCTFIVGYKFVNLGGAVYKIAAGMGDGAGAATTIFHGKDATTAKTIISANNFAYDCLGAAADAASHVSIAIRTPTTFKGYFDGAQIDVTKTITSGTQASGMIIGAYPGGSLNANIYISDVILTNTALSDADIALATAFVQGRLP